MPDIPRLFGQFLVYGLIAAGIGYLSNQPLYYQFPDDKAQIKLSFAHGAARKEPCRRLSSEEIAKLPPSQRRPNTCSRERLPVIIQLLLDGKIIYDDVLEPTGIARDGPSRIYSKFQVAPGRHVVVARLKDTHRGEGFDYEKTVSIDLTPLQNLAIDFKADQGGFLFH